MLTSTGKEKVIRSTLNHTLETNLGMLPQSRALEDSSADTPGRARFVSEPLAAIGPVDRSGSKRVNRDAGGQVVRGETGFGRRHRGSASDPESGVSRIFVLDRRGDPLMPCHPARARKLLGRGRAVVVRLHPFTIRLRDLPEPLKVMDGESVAGIDLGLTDVVVESSGRKTPNPREAFVANELIRSRDLFDRIEARPLTDEQRRTVVVDERRNLVVAAAGSGKTSVIVAKAGWLIRRGFRKPSELLLLAFARDARGEMEERIRRRLGTVADGVTVRTFHGMGMAIIGDAEGRRPALARSAESDRALFDQLKRTVSDLLAGGALSEGVVEWFQDQFAPYRSVHDFPN